MGRRQNRPKLGRAQKDARSRIQKQSSVILELHRYAEFFSKNDIEDWRRAWQSAIDPRHPSRQKLYDIYRDAMTTRTSRAAYSSAWALSCRARSSS